MEKQIKKPLCRDLLFWLGFWIAKPNEHVVGNGDDDRNVPFSESVNLAEALRRQGVEFEQLIFPDEVHGFLLHASWIRAYKAAADFFDRKLK